MIYSKNIKVGILRKSEDEVFVEYKTTAEDSKISKIPVFFSDEDPFYYSNTAVEFEIIDDNPENQSFSYSGAYYAAMQTYKGPQARIIRSF